MPRPDQTVRIHREPSRDFTWRAVLGRAGRLFTGPRRLTAFGVILLVAGLAVAGLSVFGGTPRTVPTAASRHTTTTEPSTPAAPSTPAPAKAAPQQAAAPAPQDSSVIRLQWGDTLWGLAQAHGTTVAALQQLNGLGDSTLIYAGQQLRIPGQGATTATPATAPAQPPAAQPPAPTVPTATLADTTTGTGATTSGDPSLANSNPTAATAAPAATSTSGYQGIFAFSGNNSADQATNPDVAGRSLVYYWGQLEPQQGVYRWDLIDADMAPWIAAGKKVILRVATAGWTSWDKAADSQHGTPAWVYAQGVKSVTEKDGAVLPQYWNPTFLSDLDGFLKAFAARYDGNPHVALIDLAVGVGGETKPDSEKNPNLLSLWQSIGYTDPLWWATVQQIIGSYTTAFTHTPLALMPDKTFLGNIAGYSEAKTLAYAVSKGIWLQDNGLLPGRSLPAPWGQTPIVSEQRNPTSTDGNSLAAELQAAMTEKSRIILVFTADLTNPADQAIIHQYATSSTSTVTPVTPTCPPLPVASSTVSTAMIECPLTGTSTTTGTPSTPTSTTGTTSTGKTSKKTTTKTTKKAKTAITPGATQTGLTTTTSTTSTAKTGTTKTSHKSHKKH